jgi:acetoacetyl-CoA reductase
LLERLAASYPVPRLGTALEVADLICFAASEAAGYITGASLDINGGDLMMGSMLFANAPGSPARAYV